MKTETVKAVVIGLATFFASLIFFFAAVAVGIVVGVAAIVALSVSNANAAIADQENISSLVYDPSFGMGHFQPPQLMGATHPAQWFGVELDPIAAAGIAKVLFSEESDRIFVHGQHGAASVISNPADLCLRQEMGDFTPIQPFYYHRDHAASYVRASLEAISQGEITLTKVDGFNMVVPIALLPPSVEPTLQVETERVQEIVDVSVVVEQELVVTASPEAIPTPVSPSDTPEMSLEEIKKKIESSTQAALTKWCKELQLKGWRTRKKGMTPKQVMQEVLTAYFKNQ